MAEKSKVYFADFRAPSWRENLPQKLARLMMTAGFGDIDMDGKYVAIKMHFGEPGNLAYLRPNWARAVVDLVKSHGGKPFLTDCNTLYVGGRKNALDHIESAYINGFTPYSTGCHILIADGLKGNDEVEVPVEGGEYVKSAKIGRAVMDADVFISLTHFKGHEQAGMGGALKNIGMGCGSRAVLADRLALALADAQRGDDGRTEQEHEQQRRDHRRAGAEGDVAKHVQDRQLPRPIGQVDQHFPKLSIPSQRPGRSRPRAPRRGSVLVPLSRLAYPRRARQFRRPPRCRSARSAPPPAAPWRCRATP